ncbi:MAG: DNA primase [Candidatus Peregrinibacteria bacterium]
MDAVTEIKARLPIEELVSGYCQLKKKGRVYVALCPFHNDTHPSMNVSPDKGIAYCFACRTGGDIFSFYQAIEGVDFQQAIKDLAERTGITLEPMRADVHVKDEKERLRACLSEALHFFRSQLSAPAIQEYIARRGTTSELLETFQVGYAPDSFSDTYQHLLKEGFSRKEILLAGLGVQKDLSEERIYDRFRNRLMFPIHDARGEIAGFGGRTIGEDDAKYVNSSEGPLYVKSQILFNLHRAKEAMRREKSVILVEGYFDVMACWKVGIENVAAVSGTALTEQHVTLLKRYVEGVVLCLDQDSAGRGASERAYRLCTAEGLQVRAIKLPEKDPDEVARSRPELLHQLLAEKGLPYLDVVSQELQGEDLSSTAAKRSALQRILPLLLAIPGAVERENEIRRFATVLGSTETALSRDLESFQATERSAPSRPVAAESRPSSQPQQYVSRMETALSLFLLYPALRGYLRELIPPEEGFAASLYRAIKDAPVDAKELLPVLTLTEEERERAAILQLEAEQHGFTDWAQSLAVKEIRHNCQQANRETITGKQRELSRQILEAHRAGKTVDEAQLTTQYHQVLKLAKMAG